MAQLRARLDAKIPADLRPDWTAFLAALSAESSAQQAAFAKVRESVQAAETALAATGAHPAPDR